MNFFKIRLSLGCGLALLATLSGCSTLKSAGNAVGLDVKGTRFMVPTYYATHNLPQRFSPGLVYYVDELNGSE